MKKIVLMLLVMVVFGNVLGGNGPVWCETGMVEGVYIQNSTENGTEICVVRTNIAHNKTFAFNLNNSSSACMYAMLMKAKENSTVLSFYLNNHTVLNVRNFWSNPAGDGGYYPTNMIAAKLLQAIGN